jgi:hypothetical protein
LPSEKKELEVNIKKVYNIMAILEGRVEKRIHKNKDFFILQK